MDFAKKQLEKYGWSEGKGLGKREDGISTALKPKLKFDNSGLGHNLGDEFTDNWWDNVYNSASKNIEVNSKDAVTITYTGKKSDLDKCLPLGKATDYKNLSGSFLRTAKLTQNGIENYDVPAKKESKTKAPFEAMTDEELFAACGGRTAHKGARHGLKLTGKLSRIEKQEEMLLRKLKKVSLSEESDVTKKKLKKIKKKKEEVEVKVKVVEETEVNTSSSPSKKNKHKKKKNVSFNETVTKIYSQDVESSIEGESDPLHNELANGSDEGIEQDCENNNNNNDQDDHRSFELAQFNVSDLSKAERKKLKKKRKLDVKKETATKMFLEQVIDEITKEEECEKEWIAKKRKCEFVSDQYQSTRKKNKKKKKQKEEQQFNSITSALNKVCRISDDE